MGQRKMNYDFFVDNIYYPGLVRINILGYFYQNSKIDPLAVFLNDYVLVFRSPLKIPIKKTIKATTDLDLVLWKHR